MYTYMYIYFSEGDIFRVTKNGCRNGGNEQDTLHIFMKISS